MLREYGIDLIVSIDSMSWRRFLVLLRGLSPNSATVTHRIISRVGRRPGVNTPRGPEAVQRAFEALFKPPEQRRPT